MKDLEDCYDYYDLFVDFDLFDSQEARGRADGEAGGCGLEKGWRGCLGDDCEVFQEAGACYYARAAYVLLCNDRGQAVNF